MQQPNEHQAAVEFFRRNNNKFVLQLNNSTFVKVKETSHYYRFNNEDTLGEGNFATTYKCFRFNPQTLEEEKTPFACKKVANKKKFNPAEVTFLKQFYFAEPVVEDERHAYVIQEYFPGEELIDATGEISPSLKNLNWQETLNLLYELSLAVNLIHHDTPRTGPPLSHADLSGINIKVNRIANRFNIYIFDFGSSDRLASDDATFHSEYRKGNRFYAPPETSLCLYSVKFDIHCLAPIFLKLLKARDPFSFRRNLKLTEAINEPFDYDTFLWQFQSELNSCPHPIQELIYCFIQRMCSFAPALRPDSDQLLRFTTTLRNYFLSMTQTPSNLEKLSHYAAQLTLLATNLWTKMDTGIQIDLTLDQANAINVAFKNNILTVVVLRKIVAPNQSINSQAILQLQLVELKDYRYPGYVYEALENIIAIDSTSAIRIFQKMRCFTFQQNLNFKLIMAFYKKHVQIRTSSLHNAVVDQNIIAALRAALDQHLSNLRKGQRPNTSWFNFGRISIADELVVTSRILQKLADSEMNPEELRNSITLRESEELGNSPLLVMLEDYTYIQLLRNKYNDLSIEPVPKLEDIPPLTVEMTGSPAP